MKKRILFANYGGEGNPKEGTGGGDDGGELREEDIVWGEAEIPHQLTESDIVMAGGMEKAAAEIFEGRNHRAKGRQRSMLSRQMEMMEASTWTAGDQMSMALPQKNCSSKGHEQERGSGGIEEGAAATATATRCAMDKLIPPHELLARQYATSASFSVVHGAGRTLKGMDLRRLRNEVWRKTGFVD